MTIAICLACNFLLLILWKNFLLQYEGFFFLISLASVGYNSCAHLLGNWVMLETSKHKNENSLQVWKMSKKGLDTNKEQILNFSASVRKQSWQFITLNYYVASDIKTAFFLIQKLCCFPGSTHISIKSLFHILLLCSCLQINPFLQTFPLMKKCAIWTPCALLLPVFIPGVLRPLLRLLKCENSF